MSKLERTKSDFRNLFYYFFMILTCGGSAMSMTSCSSAPTAADREVDRQVKAQPEANSPDEIAARAAEAFASAPGLNIDQKAKLKLIYERVYTQASAIRKEIGQSKSLMFKLVANNNYKSADIQRLQQKIVSLDLKRLDIMFKALEEVQQIIGYGTDKQELYWHLRHYEFPLERAYLSGM